MKLPVKDPVTIPWMSQREIPAIILGERVEGYTCALDEDDMREYCSRGGCLYYRMPSKSRKQSTLVRFTKETKND